jgi:sigma-70-like protein
MAYVDPQLYRYREREARMLATQAEEPSRALLLQAAECFDRLAQWAEQNPPPAKATIERNSLIMVHRAEGATYAEIAQRHDISKERVRQIIQSQIRRNKAPWYYKFTTRTFNCIRELYHAADKRIYSSTEQEVAAYIATFSRGDLLKVVNLGYKSALEIECWLASLGLSLRQPVLSEVSEDELYA